MKQTASPVSEEHRPGSRYAPSVGRIFVTCLIDVLSFGISFAALPHLTLDLLNGDTVRATYTYGLFATLWGAMQLLCAPAMGLLSDRFGRRPVILASNLALATDYLVMATAPTVGWLFVGRTISGITGGSFTGASAYVADVTPDERRAAGFGTIGAAFGLGMIVGPVAGGLLGTISHRLPFYVASGLMALNALYVLFLLPESLPASRRRSIQWLRANPVGSFALLRRYRGLSSLAVVAVLYYTSFQVFTSVLVLYTAHRYGWTMTNTGLALGLIGFSSALVQLLLVNPAVARFGERRCIVAGLASGAIGLAVFGWASTTVAFFAGLPVMSLLALVGPGITGLMSRRVGSSEQGQLHGTNTAIAGATGLWGPPLFTSLFALAIGRFASWAPVGAPFFMSALLLTTALVVTLAVVRPEVSSESARPAPDGAPGPAEAAVSVRSVP